MSTPVRTTPSHMPVAVRKGRMRSRNQGAAVRGRFLFQRLAAAQHLSRVAGEIDLGKRVGAMGQGPADVVVQQVDERGRGRGEFANAQFAVQKDGA